MDTCEVCSAKVSELRRGRCWGCYTTWVETRPVGLGAACCMCSERRRSKLRNMELLGTWVPICHNCGSQAAALEPMPQSIAGIRAALRRDRRGAPRRFGKADTRVYQHNRRTGDRRRGRDEQSSVDDDMILEIAELASELEALASAPLHDRFDGAELTLIRENPLSAG
jgi:hypothetical protein